MVLWLLMFVSLFRLILLQNEASYIKAVRITLHIYNIHCLFVRLVSTWLSFRYFALLIIRFISVQAMVLIKLLVLSNKLQIFLPLFLNVVHSGSNKCVIML